MIKLFVGPHDVTFGVKLSNAFFQNLSFPRTQRVKLQPFNVKVQLAASFSNATLAVWSSSFQQRTLICATKKKLIFLSFQS